MMTEIDPKEFLGKEFTLMSTPDRLGNKKEFKCFVAGIDPNIGITCKELSNQYDRICLNRHEMVTVQNGKYYNYEQCWNILITMLKNGVVDTEKFNTQAKCKSSEMTDRYYNDYWDDGRKMYDCPFENT